MAKASKKTSAVDNPTINVDLLKQIAAGFTTRISEADAMPLLKHNPPLIDVNTNDIDEQGKALVRLTEAGKNMTNGDTEVNTNGAGAEQYQIMSGLTLPARKRLGRGGGATKYPFEKMEVGNTFFVPATADNPKPVNKLASTISAQNAKYAVPTGGTKQVERVKRGPGNKAVFDEQGNKVKELVTVPETSPTRKFAMRGVKAGQTIGNWVAPSDGVLIGREA